VGPALFSVLFLSFEDGMDYFAWANVDKKPGKQIIIVRNMTGRYCFCFERILFL